MKNNLGIILGSVIIAISILSGSYLISKEVKQTEVTETASLMNAGELLTVQQAAEFLNLKEDQVKMIIETERKTLIPSDIEVVFPYIAIDGEFYISRTALVQWTIHSAQARKIYFNGQVVQ